MGTIGQSVVIRGELKAREDITIDGKIEGRIEVNRSVLTIGPNARIQADVRAKNVIVRGNVSGDITATEKIILRGTSSVNGDLVAPRVGIAEGARLVGKVDVQRPRAPIGAQASQVRSPQVPSPTGAKM